ncbi:MAG: hypothetical protein CO035_03910 [Candidatus Omnitrophica bacterium CG_4_9_14_0_2_um_filter_42_8]|nr:MAG: hypothetical protein CO035_03910 [Candidatus Omnitrophica bacterium CG_4_9_14_0_2_um_filter_42_8]
MPNRHIRTDAMARMKEYDTAVIMSGDSDFVPMVNILRGDKKKVIIVSTRWHVAKDLIRAANHYVDINRFKSVWELERYP